MDKGTISKVKGQVTVSTTVKRTKNLPIVFLSARLELTHARFGRPFFLLAFTCLKYSRPANSIRSSSYLYLAYNYYFILQNV